MILQKSVDLMYVCTAIVELGVSGAHSHTQPLSEAHARPQPLEREIGSKCAGSCAHARTQPLERHTPVHSHWRQCFECFHMDSSTKSLLSEK